MSCNKNDGNMSAYGREPLREFYARHAAELDVKHQAAELGVLGVSEKRFCRVIGDRLKSRRT